MASTIYNHRTLQPSGPPVQGPASHARLTESFDNIRQEFDVLTSDLNVLRNQRDEYESKVTSQVNELNIIRQSLYELESQHGKIRQQYEEELTRLRAELHAARSGATSYPADPTLRVEPGIRTDSGIRADPAIRTEPTRPYPDPSARVPYPPEQASRAAYADSYYAREREKERDRDNRERDREREIAREREMGRDRDRDIRDRERDRDRPGGEPPRDAKRIKTERMKSDIARADPYSPSLNTKLPPAAGQPSSIPSSIPPGQPPSVLPPQGPPSTSLGQPLSNPNQPPLAPFAGPGLPPPPTAHAPYPPGPGNPNPNANPHPSGDVVGHPSNNNGHPNGSISGPGGMNNQSLVPANQQSATQFPDDLDLHTVPADLKKEGTDWFAVFNPKVKRVLDVSLVHTLMHESVVCCVRFSADGKYLATGCNRTAQIYDTKTGHKTCILVDEAANKAGDLYIRSVCFSPDGKYLATGAEDKQIRIWDIAKKRIRNVFEGHQQEIYSLDFSLDGRLIVSGSGDKTARIWDMLDGTSKVLTINDTDTANSDAGVTSVAISPNGQLVAAGSLDTIVRIWDVATGQLVERLKGHRDSVYSVAFTPEGKGLVSGSLDKTLKFWDVGGLMVGPGGKRKEVSGPASGGSSANGKKDEKGLSRCTMDFTGHKDYVLSVAVSHDGQWVVSGSKDRGVQFWDSHSATVQCMLQGHKNSVISIDLSPAGSTLATGSGDWQARIWSYQTI